MEKTKIFFVSLSSGENNVFYAHREITEEHIRKAYSTICEDEVTDITEVKEDSLQYYNIDGRIICDTEDKKNKLFAILKEKKQNQEP